MGCCQAWMGRGNICRQNLSFKDEIKNPDFWKAARSEYLWTMLYVITGSSTRAFNTYSQPTTPVSDGSKTSQSQSDGVISELTIALTFGVALASGIQCTGHLSGGHLNPAVTLSLLFCRKVTVLRCTVYIIAQFLGGVCGAGILLGLLPPDKPLISLKAISTLPQAFGAEFIATLFLVYNYFANMDTRRTDMGSRSLYIGLAEMVSHLFAGPYTGGGLNPACCFGTALVTNTWKDHWVYWVGPILGGIIAGLTYIYSQVSTGDNTTITKKGAFKRSLKRHRPIDGLVPLAQSEHTDHSRSQVSLHTEISDQVETPIDQHVTIETTQQPET
ncbi:unnamed protein product [Owenia fusiformis]|uniref:Uncharacterized protein n=1 Tax=Owenia fusiformis TaxID=6347 RepID=A0A8J1Y7K3_OWEFU|nr:unnamed protein product [Owenia fusiformis]